MSHDLLNMGSAASGHKSVILHEPSCIELQRCADTVVAPQTMNFYEGALAAKEVPFALLALM